LWISQEGKKEPQLLVDADGVMSLWLEEVARAEKRRRRKLGCFWTGGVCPYRHVVIVLFECPIIIKLEPHKERVGDSSWDLVSDSRGPSLVCPFSG
jgi:hypothetical protein